MTKEFKNSSKRGNRETRGTCELLRRRE